MEPTLHGFFPLRSCHVTMFEDYGDLFSPVFLGSNPPPIWCNWTIVADQGKQIILHLYQFASKENCEMNEDQIIFEEFPARMEQHTLNGCWNEQFYTSQSNILYVFWLSMGSPSIGNGGFYGNYDIFEDNLPIDKTALPILHQIRGTPPVDREDNIIKNLKDKKSSLGNEMEETTEHFVQNLTPSMTSMYIESPSFLLHEERSHIPTTVEQSPLPLGQLGENSASAALYLLSTTSFPTQSTWSEAFSTEDHEDISKTGHTKLYKHLTTQSETEYLESYKHDQHPQITTPNAIESQAEYPESNRDQHSQRITTPMESETKYVQKYKHDQHLQKRTTPNEIEKYLNYKHDQHAKEREKEHQENKHDQHLQRITTPNTMGNEEEYFGSYKHDQHVIERETEFLGNYRRQQITTPNAVERETEYVGNGRDQHSQRISPNAMAKEEEYLENFKHDQRLQRIPTSNAMESEEEHLEKDWHVMAGKAVSKRFYIVNPTESETLFRTVHLQSKLPEIQSEALDFGDLEAMAALDLRGDLELEPTRVQSFSLESMFLGMHDTPTEERLKSGLLFILWLHFGFGGRSMHLLIQSYLQRLVNRPVAELGTKNALVSSVSTEDVNECSTEMLLCDAHADCFNDFGTYTCRCQDGFEDRSRAGLGGTICVNVAVSDRLDALDNRITPLELAAITSSSVTSSSAHHSRCFSHDHTCS
ncbi:hypothetical protein EOD39_11641 [Acipenser ruthenus]|uniref:Uncharacterized protein n=1 Tax=Acipenser ruthenus TaxID=7906 RepID=A0A662YRW2_ACIRT|nr:hypothetical protein EOD39_11641 [Acipenser ruthenus]